RSAVMHAAGQVNNPSHPSSPTCPTSPTSPTCLVNASRLRAEDVVDGHHFDRAEIQRADAGLDRLLVPDDDDDEVAGLDVLFRHALNGGGVRGLDVLDVVREVVVR